MNRKSAIQHEDIALRERAELQLDSVIAELNKMPESFSSEVKGLLHELQVHQIELEMQNEELRAAQLQLEKSHKEYSDLYDFAPVGYCMYNDSGKILSLNLTACKQLGCERKTLINKSFYSNIVSEDKDLFYWHLAKVFETYSPQSCEIRLKKNDGTIFYAGLESIQVRNKDIPSRSCRTTIIDITERKQAENILFIQNRLSFSLSSTTNLVHAFDSLLKAAMEIDGIDCGAVYLVDNLSGDLDLISHKGLTPEFLGLNNSLTKTASQTKTLLKGKPVYVQHTDVLNVWKSAKQKEGLRTFALIPIKHSDKVIAAIHLGSHTCDEFPVFARNMVEAIALHVGEIITRITMENQLEESEHRFRLLYENAPLAYQSLNEAGEIIDINQTWVDALGYSHEKVLGKWFGDFLTPSSKLLFKEHFPLFITEGQVNNQEFEIIKKDGSTI
ncbi:PAS domain S-box protein, partial [candidate division KSB1 bacterium]|nr:PAS domain S-box protein [candidate division KSB1 bacterium]